ncbi:hypothetical protein RSAG8_02441, partial [Rhizoctonia solani AG-8 WAC10335]
MPNLWLLLTRRHPSQGEAIKDK